MTTVRLNQSCCDHSTRFHGLKELCVLCAWVRQRANGFKTDGMSGSSRERALFPVGRTLFNLRLQHSKHSSKLNLHRRAKGALRTLGTNHDFR